MLAMLAEWQDKNSRPRLNQSLRSGIGVLNDSEFPIPRGELRQLKELQNQELAVEDFNEELFLGMVNSPVFTVEDPVWHSKIDNLVVITRDLDVEDVGAFRSARYQSVSITNTPPSEIQAGWAMPDPDNPKLLKFCKTSGIYRVVGWFDCSNGDTENIAVVDTQDSQNLWRYRLNESSKAPDVTTAKLYDMNDVLFALEINLSDPDGFMDDQAPGDKGFCIYASGEFYAIQAACL
jgi:hypothetical protein